VSDLIDTTEMYLRTLFELGEEGVPPLRARIAERLHQSGPTVSQTVARMERDGLVVLNADRQLELTPLGAQHATAVMRKHRLAERLLLDVIGLDWADVHAEACRWEHVMSESVEKRIVALLGQPSVSPYGNPIPGLAELSDPTAGSDRMPPVEPPAGVLPLSEALDDRPRAVRIVAIGEHLQTDVELMRELDRSRLRPGSVITAVRVDADTIELSASGGGLTMPFDACANLFVSVV
jgi:DtxR family Mn-dependent transcriptional regulator